jgi:ABC-type antimicrobial peptide transport system permease subunit
MFTLPSVIHTNNARNAYYSVGADCYYDGQWDSNLEVNLSRDPNIATAVPMGISEISMSPGSSLTSFILFPEFLEVAYFESDFCDEEIMKELHVTPLSVLVNTKYLEIFRKDIGDTIPISKGDGEVIPLTIIGIFQYWPNFIMNSPSNPDAEPKLIATNTTITDLSLENVSTSMIVEGYYLKLSANADINQMEEKFGQDTLLFAHKVAQTTDELIIVRLLQFQIELLFLLCCLTISISIFIFGYTQLRARTRELAVERTLGMKLLQLARIFFYESLVSLIFSLFLGLILGIIFTISLISIWMMMLNPSMVPPPVFFISWIAISVQIGLVISVGLISSIFPAILARKHRIGTSLKVI